MRIKFLGTGSAFINDAEVINLLDGRKGVLIKNFQSNILVTSDDGRNMLLDCGTDIRFAMMAHGLTVSDIHAVYVSHLHADHCGGLEYAGFMSYFGATVFGKARPQIFAQTKVLKDLWNNTLKGGMESIENIDATLSTYFNPSAIPNSGSFDFNEISCKLIQTIHVVADSHFQPSYGLMMHDTSIGGAGGKNVFWTSDTQYSPSQLKKFIKSADIVFHDCETTNFQSGVHAHYEDLKTLPAESKAKMWLYHYNNPYHELPDAVSDGFAGFVMPGQEFII